MQKKLNQLLLIVFGCITFVYLLQVTLTQVNDRLEKKISYAEQQKTSLKVKYLNMSSVYTLQRIGTDMEMVELNDDNLINIEASKAMKASKSMISKHKHDSFWTGYEEHLKQQTTGF